MQEVVQRIPIGQWKCARPLAQYVILGVPSADGRLAKLKQSQYAVSAGSCAVAWQFEATSLHVAAATAWRKPIEIAFSEDCGG